MFWRNSNDPTAIQVSQTPPPSPGRNSGQKSATTGADPPSFGAPFIVTSTSPANGHTGRDDTAHLSRSISSPIDSWLRSLHEKHRQNELGKLASYISELTNADPKHFGIVLAAADGNPTPWETATFCLQFSRFRSRWCMASRSRITGPITFCATSASSHG